MKNKKSKANTFLNEFMKFMKEEEKEPEREILEELVIQKHSRGNIEYSIDALKKSLDLDKGFVSFLMIISSVGCGVFIYYCNLASLLSTFVVIGTAGSIIVSEIIKIKQKSRAYKKVSVYLEQILREEILPEKTDRK